MKKLVAFLLGLVVVTTGLFATPAFAVPNATDRSPKIKAQSMSGDRWYITTGYLRTVSSDASWVCESADKYLANNGFRRMETAAFKACNAVENPFRQYVQVFPRKATHAVILIDQNFSWKCMCDRVTITFSMLYYGLPA